MKFAFRLLCVLASLSCVSVQAFAMGKAASERSWSDLQNDKIVKIEWPTVTFAGLGFVPITNVCQNGDHFRTIKPVEYCAKTQVTERFACRMTEHNDVCRKLHPSENPRRDEFLRETTVCAEKASQIGETPRTYSYQGCIKWRETEQVSVCEKYGDISVTMPLAWYVSFYNNHWAERPSFMGVKEFDLPACR